MNNNHPFYKMKHLLQEQGWYVGWAHPCCQTCAWQEIPFEHPDGPREGEQIDFNKLLFNHEQDCDMECEYDEEKNEYILPEGMTHDDYSVIPAYKPEQTTGSLFCFNGDSIQLLIEAISLIESTGCKVHWNHKPDSRIYIEWKIYVDN